MLLPDELMIGTPTCTAQLVAAYEKTGGNVVAVMDVPREQTSSYGIVEVKGATGRPGRDAPAWSRSPTPGDAPSTLRIIGRYICSPRCSTISTSRRRGAGGEIQLTDAMAKMIGHQPFHALKATPCATTAATRLGFVMPISRWRSSATMSAQNYASCQTPPRDGGGTVLEQPKAKDGGGGTLRRITTIHSSVNRSLRSGEDL